MITLRNNYHGTVVRIHPRSGEGLSQTQVRRVRRTLCGIAECKCGGHLSERGPQGDSPVEEEAIARLLWGESWSGA